MSTLFLEPRETDNASATLTADTSTTGATPTSYGLGLGESSSGTSTLLETSTTLENFTVDSAPDFTSADPRLNYFSEQAIAFGATAYTQSETTPNTDELTGLSIAEASVASSATASTANTLFGSLDYSDEIDWNQAYSYAYRDDYLLSGLNNQTVQINLDSSEFDAYLELIDASTGTIIAADDDSGGGSNAQLNFTAQAGGQYFIRATSFYDYQIGSYSLSAYIGDETSPAPPTSPPTEPSSFDSDYGYGLVDAASAVAAGIGQSRFSDVANSDSWDNDLISAPEAWAQGYTGRGVTVAVIDSGVDIFHEDLRNNIWSNAGEIAGNGVDDDGNGYIDDIYGWNFAQGQYNNDVRPGGDGSAGQSHGTHVAGTIAAANNGLGMTGVAYGANIMALRIGDVVGGSFANQGSIAEAIRYAVDNGASVINMSLGGGSGSDGSVREALAYAASRNVIAVMASGNSAGSNPIFPASYATDYGLSVGAVDAVGDIASFSNRAGGDSRMQHVMAPGVEIYSTLPNNSYGIISGTSMAAPHVAGVVALMLSANPNLTHDQVRAILTGTAVASGGGTSAIAYSNLLELSESSSSSATESGSPTQDGNGIDTEIPSFDWALPEYV